MSTLRRVVDLKSQLCSSEYEFQKLQTRIKELQGELDHAEKELQTRTLRPKLYPDSIEKLLTHVKNTLTIKDIMNQNKSIKKELTAVRRNITKWQKLLTCDLYNRSHITEYITKLKKEETHYIAELSRFEDCVRNLETENASLFKKISIQHRYWYTPTDSMGLSRDDEGYYRNTDMTNYEMDRLTKDLANPTLWEVWNLTSKSFDAIGNFEIHLEF